MVRKGKKSSRMEKSSLLDEKGLSRRKRGGKRKEGKEGEGAMSFPYHFFINGYRQCPVPSLNHHLIIIYTSSLIDLPFYKVFDRSFRSPLLYRV